MVSGCPTDQCVDMTVRDAADRYDRRPR
ncbi:hypothetical protein M3484_06565 [Pseudomonas sp. GX19020]|nr:hypothetical protein [Pseudomonas sp. GX19020]